MANLIGQRIGQYEITAKLGAGGMATVYRAKQSAVGRDVAIKIIASKLVDNPEFIARFEREARTIASLNHPNILKLFDFGHFGDLLYFAMELQPGGSLTDKIRRQSLPLAEATRLFGQIADALDYAHSKGIVHRDLKPQNVLLDERDNAILSDFGLAKLLNTATQLTQEGAAMGTPLYMPPEQWLGEAVDSRSDIYALGVMAFEMLTGRVPFNADTPLSMKLMHLHELPPPVRRFRAEIPEAVGEVLDRALAKNPDMRYQKVSDFAAAFHTAMTTPAAPVTPASVATAATSGRTDLVQPRQPSVGVPAPQTSPQPGAVAQAKRGLPIRVIAVIVIATLALGALLIGRGGSGQPTPPTTPGVVAQAATTSAPSPTLAATGTPESVVIALPPTQTRIPTRAATRVPTATRTPTRTQPATQTPSHTASATITPTRTATTTETPAFTATPSLTEPPGIETIVAQTVSARASATALIEAYFTRTPTPTPTATPDLPQTAAAIIGATDTAVAIASFTRTPTPTLTPSLTPTPTTTPTITPTAPPAVTANNQWTPVTQTFDGVEMVLVPPGCFMMGSDSGNFDEMPVHQVCFDQPFWIDKYEVTNGQFDRLGGQAGSASAFPGDDRPRETITWFEARKFCAKRGGRLPTEAEWEFAARGPDGRIYPWGNDFVSENVVHAYGGVSSTANVGSKPGGASWVGALDLSGNVSEWVNSLYKPYPYKMDDGREADTGTERGVAYWRVLRGGSYNAVPRLTRSTYRLSASPDFDYDGYGFRCARDYIPTTSPTPTPVSSAALAAVPSVTANNQWTPVTQTFDGVEMVLVPPGCFMMGSDSGDADEKPVHQVCFDKPFWIDKYEVTNEQFDRLGGKASKSSWWKDDSRPREQVSWSEAQSFCSKRGARLPSEAEWEYAARGPDNLLYPWGNEFVAEYAVYSHSFQMQTAPVGSKPGGVSWVGALDMSGNVMEWVADWYDAAYYAMSSRISPSGPQDGQIRSARGGSWANDSDAVRTTNRSSNKPDVQVSSFGFRCARNLD